MAVDSTGRARVVEESATIRLPDSKYDWILSSGAIREGAFLEEVLQERSGATYEYTGPGFIAVVVDASPSITTDRVWHVKLVHGERWYELVAPVVPFEKVADFINALVGAN
jgi:hypothetical protein